MSKAAIILIITIFSLTGINSECEKEPEEFVRSCTVQFWAKPVSWSPYYELSSHAGSIGYKVTLDVIGDTQVRGRIRYWDTNGRQVERDFYDSIEFRTGNSFALVELKLKGEPLGSSVRVTYNPC